MVDPMDDVKFCRVGSSSYHTCHERRFRRACPRTERLLTGYQQRMPENTGSQSVALHPSRSHAAIAASILEDRGQRQDSTPSGCFSIGANHVITELPVELKLMLTDLELLSETAADRNGPLVGAGSFPVRFNRPVGDEEQMVVIVGDGKGVELTFNSFGNSVGPRQRLHRPK
jgi:hypothetical protein